MEEKVSMANLAILDPTAKTILRSGYGLGDIEGQPLTVEIQDPTVKIQTYLY